MGHMATVQTLYARHHRPPLSDLFEPRSGLMENSNEAAHEQKCEDEEKVAISDEDEENIDCIVAVATDHDERKRLEKLAALVFRPGARLSGTVQIQKEKLSRSNYDLVVMEDEAVDELGRPKGMLARHKFAGDEQCVYVKLSYVNVPAVKKKREEEKESISDEEAASKGGESASDEGGHCELGALSKKKLTIQIEYADGDHRIQGLWNHDALCFEGTMEKMTESQEEQNQMGGTIVSGLISGHSGYDDQGPFGDEHGDRNIVPSRLSPPNVGTRSFLLSPCSHLHPRGIAPPPLWLSISETLSRIGLLTVQAEGIETGGSVVRFKEPYVAASPKDGVKDSRIGKATITSERRRALLDELASSDNRKLVLHRARTDALRRETLAKLVDLGSVVDFAELARKRNVASRRERWRRRLRRYNPASLLPRGLLSRRRGTTGVVSKDDVEKKKVQFYDQLAAISWGDLLEEASVRAERTCAFFRRQAALLDRLTFESDEYKAQVMSDLRANKLTLAGSHSQWDRCIQSGRTVALGWSWFERGSWGCFERSAVVGRRCVHLLFQMHSRLEANHKELEKAYRGADARLTNVQLEKIRTGSCAAGECGKHLEGDGGEGAKDQSDGLCGVCQCDMEEEGESEGEDNPSIRLPCGHSFHWKCIREWLHNHSQCPICRVDLRPL